MEMIISLSSGQGISGILMNVIGFIVIASVNTDDIDNDAKYGAIIFFFHFWIYFIFMPYYFTISLPNRLF
jgi:hypothetical protein